jgi:hypothetical protein
MNPEQLHAIWNQGADPLLEKWLNVLGENLDRILRKGREEFLRRSFTIVVAARDYTDACTFSVPALAKSVPIRGRGEHLGKINCPIRVFLFEPETRGLIYYGVIEKEGAEVEFSALPPPSARS